MAKMETSKEDMKQDKAMADKEIRKAFKEHDAQEHKGQHTKLKLKKGGLDKVKKMAKGGVTNSNLKSMGRNMARVANQKSSSRGR
jgi:cell wall assembly regulator SMI1